MTSNGTTDWTRLSFFYLCAYLTFGGLGLLVAPASSLSLLGSNGSYGDVMPRMVGGLMLALAIIVAGIIRRRVEAMYTITLVVRAFLCVLLLGFFVAYGDPFFAVILGIVVFGMSLTTVSYIRDRKSRETAAP